MFTYVHRYVYRVPLPPPPDHGTLTLTSVGPPPGSRAKDRCHSVDLPQALAALGAPGTDRLSGKVPGHPSASRRSHVLEKAFS